MVIDFEKSLQWALDSIEKQEYHELEIHPLEKMRDDEIISIYGSAKWKIVDLLNQNYSTVLNTEFDLYNWLVYQENDEVAYFLNEAGSNALNYSQFGAPSKFHLWMGKSGFIIGIEQKGSGFNALKTNSERLKENQGAAFEFFRKCKNKIFFDNPLEAKTVFMLWRRD